MSSKTKKLEFVKFVECSLTPNGIETVVDVRTEEGSIERRTIGPYPLQANAVDRAAGVEFDFESLGIPWPKTNPK